MWGLAPSFGFPNHWISVCSSLEPETLRLGKGGRSGHPQVGEGDAGLALPASHNSTLQAVLCSNLKKTQQNQSSEKNIFKHEPKEIQNFRVRG